MSNTPSDAELIACYREANGEMHGKAQPPTTQQVFRAMRAAIVEWGTPQPAPVPLSEREEIAMIDAAMVEMANIVPPLKRSECARLIRAAIAAQGCK